MDFNKVYLLYFDQIQFVLLITSVLWLLWKEKQLKQMSLHSARH